MIFKILGIIIILPGVYFVFRELIKRKLYSEKVEGRIVAFEVRSENYRGAKTNYYYPVYEYEIDKTVYKKATTQCSRMEDWYKIGDVATLYYNSINHEEIRVSGYYGEYIYGAVYIIIGLILFIIGII